MKKTIASLLLLVALMSPAPHAPGQTLSENDLHSFGAPRGVYPGGALVQDGDGNFYGTTSGGGTGYGTVFKITPAGALTTLHSFNGTDGTGPVALARGRDGNFYGTATGGGSKGNGTVFRMTPAGVLTTLHEFTGTGTEGARPSAGLTLGRDGNFYGTTEFYGSGFNGTVFKITPAGVFTTLHDFNGAGTEGINPTAVLALGRDGNFYGTTDSGGSHQQGTVFKVTPAGAFTSLHSFSSADLNAFYPSALVLGGDGNFYGTTHYGGIHEQGTAFKITPAGAFTSLHNFGSAGTDGIHPLAALVLGGDGNFYGTTGSGGGSGGTGTVFKMTPAGALTTLHTFHFTDGSSPRELAPGGDGNFYGVASGGGGGGAGTVFKITPAGALTTLREFSFTDGVSPSALVQGRDGNFYGTTDSGGSGYGTFFKLTPATGALAILHTFDNTDGADPDALTQGSDGNFYGTTFGGDGGNGGGTIFKITAAGALTTLHTFTGTDENSAETSGLVQGSDGDFYGLTGAGGSDEGGTAFKITPAGVFTSLHDFGTTDSDGSNPVGLLVQGHDGNFYGTTAYGGNDGNGTVFKMTPAGVVTILHNFLFSETNGYGPLAGLALGKDGNFYGTTIGDGERNGMVFRITPTGTFTILHRFNSSGAEGADPQAALVLGRDGNFYGTTSAGGSNGAGTVFRITPAGTLTVLYDLTGPGHTENGNDAALLLGRDGSFYGTASDGGSGGYGTVFKIGYFPAITSAATATATQGQAFMYQITATNSPTSYGVLGLPPGLHVDAATGLISGTPTTAGKRTVTLKATNASGTGTAALTLTIELAPPEVTSADSAAATVSKVFSYQITATNSPTNFGVLGLPPGLHVDGKTGLISGTPTKAGTVKLTLKAANAAGIGQATVTLTISK